MGRILPYNLSVGAGYSNPDYRIRARWNFRPEYKRTKSMRTQYYRDVFPAKAPAISGELYHMSGSHYVRPCMVARNHYVPELLALLRTHNLRRGGISTAKIRAGVY